MKRELAPPGMSELLHRTYDADYEAKGEYIIAFYLRRDELGKVVGFEIVSWPPRPSEN